MDTIFSDAGVRGGDAAALFGAYLVPLLVRFNGIHPEFALAASSFGFGKNTGPGTCSADGVVG
eukprot:COSAG01_NODE_4080_length_5376_cov_171.292401_9_plen_63_part_00